MTALDRASMKRLGEGFLLVSVGAIVATVILSYTSPAQPPVSEGHHINNNININLNNRHDNSESQGAPWDTDTAKIVDPIDQGLDPKEEQELVKKWKTHIVKHKFHDFTNQPSLNATVKGINRIVLATIPRSGNGWFRGLLEASTGLATHSVFPEKKSVLFNATNTYVSPCGWLSDCKSVRAGKGLEPAVIKTHFPFTSQLLQVEIDKYISEGRSDAGSASYLVLPVRNPLDNHEAWSRYVNERFPDPSSAPHLGLRPFVDAWARHHNFWFAQGVPSAIYRYEDLVDDPIETLSMVLHASGLWSQLKLSETNLLKVSNITRLQAYKRKQIGAQTRKKDDMSQNYKKYSYEDIKWILQNHRDTLRRYGYDKVYDIWIQAKQVGMSDAAVLNAVRDAMQHTARFANWAEAWKPS